MKQERAGTPEDKGKKNCCFKKPCMYECRLFTLEHPHLSREADWLARCVVIVAFKRHSPRFHSGVKCHNLSFPRNPFAVKRCSFHVLKTLLFLAAAGKFSNVARMRCTGKVPVPIQTLAVTNENS